MEENNKEPIEEPIQEVKQETLQEQVQPDEMVQTSEEQVQPTETVQASQETKSEPKFTPMGQINEPIPKKKKGKLGAVIFVLLLVLAIVGGLAYYYFQVYTNPKVVYQQILKTGIDDLTQTTDEVSTAKVNLKLDVDLSLENDALETSGKELLDLINNTDAMAEIQMDMNNKKALIKFESNYENEELLNFDMFLDAENKESYIQLEQFFDDVLEIELEDEYYEELKNAFEIEQETDEQGQNRAKIVKILKSEVAKIIKDEYCSKENEKITINEKEINTTKYILKMTNVQVVNELKTVIENLKNNEEFLTCFDNKEDGKQTLEDLLTELAEIQINEEVAIYVKVYRTGLKQEVVRIDFEVENDGERLTLKFEKTEKAYDFEVTFGEEVLCSGAIALESINESATKINFELEIQKFGTISLDMEYGYVLNEAIDAMDTDEAVKMDELSQGDILKAYEELESSKLYELIEEFASLGNSDLEYDDDYYEDEDNETTTEIDGMVSTKAVLTKGGTFIVFASNNHDVPVDMDVEVEFYDENGLFLGNSTDYLMAVGAGQEVAMEMWGAPVGFSTYKIYTDVEESDEKEYFNQIEMTHNNNGQNIAVQVKNNSKDVIEYISVAVVYYNKGEVVGITDGISSDVKPGRSGNFVLDFPYDSNYENVEFDNYKVLVTGAYSYNW